MPGKFVVLTDHTITLIFQQESCRAVLLTQKEQVSFFGSPLCPFVFFFLLWRFRKPNLKMEVTFLLPKQYCPYCKSHLQYPKDGSMTLSKNCDACRKTFRIMEIRL